MILIYLAALKKTFLENYEDIEILRFLENGKKVKMIKLNSQFLCYRYL